MNNYEAEAVRDMEISEDGLGLFCSVPSEMDKDRRYTVRCTESASDVVVTSCTCKGFYYYKRCKHVSMVQAYWNRIYKPTPKVEAPKEATVKKVCKPRNGLVRKVRNGGLVLVKAPTKVEQVAIEVGITVEQVQEIAVIAAEHNREKLEGKHTPMCLPIGPRDTKKDMMKAALTTNKGFQLMR